MPWQARTSPRPRRDAQPRAKYFAAIVQLSTMPQALSLDPRAMTPRLGDAGEVTMLLFEMDPAVFAVKSYRHYVALGGGGPAFLAMLMREGLAP